MGVNGPWGYPVTEPDNELTFEQWLEAQRKIKWWNDLVVASVDDQTGELVHERLGQINKEPDDS